MIWNVKHFLPDKIFFLGGGAFYGFIDRTAEDMTGNKEREGGSDTQQRDPCRKSNPGPLQSLGTWDAHSTHWAKRRPTRSSFSGVSIADPHPPSKEIRDEDRNISFNIPKEAPFYLSHFTINGNVQFNMHKWIGSADASSMKFQRTVDQLCSKECSVQCLCRWFGELYFSAEKHYEW